MKEIYVNLTWNKKKKKKKTNFGKVWGKLPESKANATAILTGNGLVVVDIDTKNFKTIDHKLINLLGEPTVETKRGYHYYFNVEDSTLFTTRSKVFDNVDLRGDGGLIFNSYVGDNKNIAYKQIGETHDMPKKLSKYILKQLNNNKPKSKNKKSKFNYNNTDKNRVKELLSYIDCYDDYDEWYQVGMSLKAWDEVEGLKLWDKWSKQSSNYDGGTEYKWKSFNDDGNLGLGTLYHLAEQGGYVIPHAPDFTKKKGISVQSDDYKTPEMAIERNSFSYESWMGESPLDKKAVIAYLKNTGYDVKGSRFRWVSSSGKIREFVKQDVANFFKTYNIKDEETEESIAHIDEWLSEHGTLANPNPKEYWKHIHKCMLDWVMFHHQYHTMRLKVDPFGTNGVAFDEDVMVVVTNTVIPKEPNKVHDESIIADYKEHFPQLDQVLDVMLSARFGADRKKAYIWMKAVSDWGKSFLFLGVLKALGITTIMKEKELKLAMTGSPTGLTLSDFAKSWLMVFDEFSGAIKELKDITHTLTIAPKGQSRVEVDLYTKIFLSAENVNSLVGDSGADTQFANRFMMMDLVGKLTDRKLYMNNNNFYLDVIRRYVYEYLTDGVKMYIDMGENKASIHANKVLMSFRTDNELQSEDLMERLSDEREVYYKTIKQKLKTFGNENHEIEDLFAIKDKELYIKKLGLVKEHFLRTVFAHSDIQKFNHKSSLELLGLEMNDRTKITLDGIRQNVYKAE